MSWFSSQPGAVPASDSLSSWDEICLEPSSPIADTVDRASFDGEAFDLWLTYIWASLKGASDPDSPLSEAERATKRRESGRHFHQVAHEHNCPSETHICVPMRDPQLDAHILCRHAVEPFDSAAVTGLRRPGGRGRATALRLAKDGSGIVQMEADWLEPLAAELYQRVDVARVAAAQGVDLSSHDGKITFSRTFTLTPPVELEPPDRPLQFGGLSVVSYDPANLRLVPVVAAEITGVSIDGVQQWLEELCHCPPAKRCLTCDKFHHGQYSVDGHWQVDWSVTMGHGIVIGGAIIVTLVRVLWWP